MNGLRWLRIRCNLSTSELADQLGVTRQAVCSWESGKKAIPEKRKNQMAVFFGIDRAYFDEIDEEKRNELIQKAMYFYQKMVKRYTYIDLTQHLKVTMRPSHIFKKTVKRV